MMVKPVIVLAGGLGTRLTPITGGAIPKILAPVLGKPFLFYKLKSLYELGAREVVLLIGELGEQVVDYVANNELFGLKITCVSDGDVLSGTAGAIIKNLAMLPEFFWVTYGDTIVVTDLLAAQQFMATEGTNGLMCVLKNNDEYQTSNVDVSVNRVKTYEKNTKVGSHSYIDYGLLLFSKNAFTRPPHELPVDMKIVIDDLITKNDLSAWEVDYRFWDIGTPEALLETENYLSKIFK